jgi:hypothetical protein
MSAIIRSYRLPFGFKATFRWRDGHLGIEWSPRVPRITKPRPWRKLFSAYQAARRNFFHDVAAVIGNNSLVVDTDLKTIDGINGISAPTVH